MIASLQKPLIHFITSSRGFSELSKSLSEAFEAYPGLSVFILFALIAVLLSVGVFVLGEMVYDTAKNRLSALLPDTGWWLCVGGLTGVYCVMLAFGGSYSSDKNPPADLVESPKSWSPKSGQILTRGELEKLALRTLVVVDIYDKKNRLIGKGSGFFFKQANRIVTNEHVVSRAGRIRVRKPTSQNPRAGKTRGSSFQKDYPAKVILSDATADIAVLETTYQNDVFLSEGKPETLSIGEEVHVASNPGHMDGVFASGLLAHRFDHEGLTHLTITAFISPGSSGSAVINSRGEVIGVATGVMGHKSLQLGIVMPITYAISALRQHETMSKWKSSQSFEARNRSGKFGKRHHPESQHQSVSSLSDFK